MIIRAYGGLPITYVPDVGEVVEARRSPMGRFVRAVVLGARRRAHGGVEIKVHWLDSDPDAGVTEGPGRTLTGERVPIVAGTVGWVKDRRLAGVPPLIRQVDGGGGRSGVAAK